MASKEKRKGRFPHKYLSGAPQLVSNLSLHKANLLLGNAFAALLGLDGARFPLVAVDSSAVCNLGGTSPDGRPFTLEFIAEAALRLLAKKPKEWPFYPGVTGARTLHNQVWFEYLGMQCIGHLTGAESPTRGDDFIPCLAEDN